MDENSASIFRRPSISSDAGNDAPHITTQQRTMAAEPGAASRRLGGGTGLRQTEQQAGALMGRGPILTGARKFNYDVVAGRGSEVSFFVTRDSVMSDAQARDALHRVHVMFGVDREDHVNIYAFDQALFFCYTLNSGSVLVPGRALFSFQGSQQFEYKLVRDMLGADLRRFGRAFADDIREVNGRVIRQFDPYDADKAQMYYGLMQVAHSRGTARCPDLTHDTAEFCTGLSPSERAMVTAAANTVISSNVNSADRMRNNDRVQSAEGYDSTTGTVINHVASAAGAAARGFAGA